MQFPLSPIPLVGGKEDTTGINQTWPSMPVRPINERTSTLVFRNIPPRPPKEERPPVQYAPRVGEDRRKGDRRKDNRGAMFDTRSGTDRRQNKRRETDTTTRLNVKA